MNESSLGMLVLLNSVVARKDGDRSEREKRGRNMRRKKGMMGNGKTQPKKRRKNEGRKKKPRSIFFIEQTTKEQFPVFFHHSQQEPTFQTGVHLAHIKYCLNA